MNTDHLDDLDRRLRALEETVARLCAATGVVEAIPAERVAHRPPPIEREPDTAPVVAEPITPPPTAAAPAPRAKARPLIPRGTERPTEEMLGGRGLAILGGAAVLIGIVFFVAIAIRRGLIPVSVRMLLAALGCVLLLVAADYVHRRIGGRVLVAVLATVAVLGGFATLVGTIGNYHLLPESAAFGIAPAIGAIAFAAARRFGLRFLAILGTIFAILEPAMCGIDPSAGLAVYALLVFAASSAHAVMLRPAGTWIAGLLLAPTFTLSWAMEYEYDSVRAAGNLAPLIATIAYLAIHLATAYAGDRTWRDEHAIPIVIVPALPAGLLIGAAVGTAILSRGDQPDTRRNIWMTVLALILIAGGAAWTALERRRLIGPVTAAVGFVLLAVAFGMWFDGPALVVAWSAQSVAAAWVATRVGDDRLLVGPFATIVLAVAAALQLAPPRGLGWTIDDPARAVVATFVIAAAFALIAVATNTLPERHIPMSDNRTALLGTAAAIAVLYGTSIWLVQGLGTGEQSTQVVLSVYWSVIGLGMIVAGLLRDRIRIRIAGLTLLGIALGKLVTFDLRYLDSTNRALAFILVGLFALAGAYAYQRIRSQVRRRERTDNHDRPRPVSP